MEAKEQLRSGVLARRNSLPEDVRARKSTVICERLASELAAAFAEAGVVAPTVAVFASMRSEVDTHIFVEVAYERGWRVCFPCMVREGHEATEPARMQFYRVEPEQLDAARARFLDTPMRCLACEKLERDGFKAVEPEEFDAVTVPLVAFDNEGRRLGYGGGNYDQLLPRLRGDAVVVGIAFEEQRVEAVPCEPHDIPLPRVVSA